MAVAPDNETTSFARAGDGRALALMRAHLPAGTMRPKNLSGRRDAVREDAELRPNVLIPTSGIEETGN